MANEPEKEFQIETVQDIFTIVKLDPICNNYTNVNAKSGLYHRMKGKGTNGKPQDLTAEDLETVFNGMDKFIEQYEALKFKYLNGENISSFKHEV